jgi:iron uptake system component EfeO
VTRRFLACLAVLVLVAVGACSSDDSSSSSTTSAAGEGTTIDITLSDAGCAPRDITAGPGETTFHVSNDGSAAVTEFEVLDGGKIIGEVENVIPGADKSFSVELKTGSYTTKCPGGSDFDAGTLEVA